MAATVKFTRAEKQLLVLPVPCLNLSFLWMSASDEEFAARAELIGYTGTDALVKRQDVGCLRALMRDVLGAIS